MRDKLRLLIVVSVVCLLVAACTGNDSGSKSGSNAGQAQPAGGAPASRPSRSRIGRTARSASQAAT